jgi:hypothetical protein
MNLRLLTTSLFLTAIASAQVDPAPLSPTLTEAVQARTAWPFEHVLHDTGADGRLWACGATWKASFGRDGFVYHPRLGGEAPARSLGLRLVAARVGGRPLTLPAATAPQRDGDVVTFVRGPVREVYALGLQQVEQSFVVDTTEAGDVELELAVTTDLAERADVPGLQFSSAHGGVDYGDAFVVANGADKLPIETTWNGERITLRVAAGQRGRGPVVVDPILSTQAVGLTGANDVYLVVWEHVYSSADRDVYCEMFDANGVRMQGSSATIDISTVNVQRPRVANLDAADRFLVAVEADDPQYGYRRMIWSRTREAASPTVGPVVLLSDPARPGNNYGPDVGADSGTGGFGPHDFLVVWTNIASAVSADVLGRAVLASGQPKHSFVLVIEGGTAYCGNAQVSRSNGNGVTPHALWLVVYSRYVGNYTHVLGRTLDLSYSLGLEIPLDDSDNANLYPQVSSPIVNAGKTSFMVTYERYSAAKAMVVHFQPAWQGTHYFDLTTQYTVPGESLRTESDGARFVVVSKGNYAGEFAARTFGWLGYGLQLNDGPHYFGQVGSTPEIASCRASAGPLGRHAIVWRDGTSTNATAKLARYGGWQSGPTISVMPTACHGMGISHAGTPLLGATLQFTAENLGADIPGFAFGWAAANPVPLCLPCSLGLRLDAPIDVSLGTPTMNLTIPPLSYLVGLSYGVQAIGYGSGSCFGALRLSDTVQFTVR